jgi:hypothetical protein
MQKKWTENEINLLKKYYNKNNKFELLKLFDRSWSSIQNKAFKLGIHKFFNNVEKLIDGSLESYYWLGFIMADGHFSKNKTLEVNLANKDIEHLIKLNNFFERSININQPRLSISINKIWDRLVQMFNICSNKTYNPCSLSGVTGDELFALTIGFIDGDGSIDKKGGIRVKCHMSWLNNLKVMFSAIADNCFYNCYINNENLALATLGSIECTKKIKNKAEKLNLPILRRKWDRVLNDRLSKKETTLKNKNNCYTLFTDNKSIKQVIEQTGLSQSQVYKQYSEYKQQSIKEKDIKRQLEKNI